MSVANSDHLVRASEPVTTRILIPVMTEEPCESSGNRERGLSRQLEAGQAFSRENPYMASLSWSRR